MNIHPPPPETIRSARLAAGLTQSQAARLVHSSLRSWQQWEGGERRMHLAFWDLFVRRTKRLIAQESPR